MSKLILRRKGGAGSGNWGHAGRPGLVGGSGGTGGAIAMAPGSISGGESLDFFMDDFSPSGTWEVASTEDRRLVKEDLIRNLAERTGLDEELVNEVIKQWSHTSNDDDKRSLSLQEAAAEELGLKLSDWQQSKVDTVEKPDTSWIAKQYPYFTPEQVAAEAARLTKGPAHQSLTSRENERAIIRAMYDTTQEKLSAAGFKPTDTIELHRGIQYGDDKPSFSVGDTVSYKGNSIESWSVGESVANQFASGMSEEPIEWGATVSMSVPVSSIISTAHTGFGCLQEGEVLIAGNVPGSKALVAKVIEPIDYEWSPTSGPGYTPGAGAGKPTTFAELPDIMK